MPRDSRPNPVRARLRSLLLLAFGGASVLLTTEERVCDRVLQHPDADRQGDTDAAHDGKALLWVHRAWNHRSFGVKGLGERGTQDAVVRLGQAGWVARAVVFAGIGIAALGAAVTDDAAKARGVDGCSAPSPSHPSGRGCSSSSHSG